MIPVYSAPHEALTPAVQDAMRATWQSMCINEGWLDSKAIPTPHDGGVWQQDNEMTFVAYVADEGAVVYSHRGPIIRKLADQFGYQKATNFKAAVLACTSAGLLKAHLEDGEQVLSMTGYGWETLKRWEWYKENEV